MKPEPFLPNRAVGRVAPRRYDRKRASDDDGSIVDTLPDERLEDVLDYLAELSERISR